MQVYLGRITLTSNYCLSIHFGREPTTSASPPVLINGTPSDATKRIFFITNPPTLLLIMIIQQSSAHLKREFGYFCPHPPYFLYWRRNLSAIRAMNSEFVGFPFPLLMVYPKRLSRVSILPLFHATSMAWRMALSTLLEVVW